MIAFYSLRPLRSPFASFAVRYFFNRKEKEKYPLIFYTPDVISVLRTGLGALPLKGGIITGGGCAVCAPNTIRGDTAVSPNIVNPFDPIDSQV